jgi:quercetin dioxygenase-like cupin family protein
VRTVARRAVAAVAVVAVVGALPGPAAASPPLPLISKLQDLARAQAVGGGPATAPPGTDTGAASYTLPPGGGTGWRTAAGTVVLAVTEGKLTLRLAKGCATRELATGQAAVVPPGRFLIANGGTGPLRFAGIFMGLREDGPQPLAGGAGGPAPAGCAKPADGPQTVAAEQVRGTMVAISEYGVSVPKPGEANRIVVQEAKDVLVASYQFQPKFSTGWRTHLPALLIVTRGTMTYYEGQAGQCVIAGEYSAGQAYTHAGGLHLATNEGPEIVDMTAVYFNLPHGGAGALVPVLGNTLDANDFTPLPPRDCPSLS